MAVADVALLARAAGIATRLLGRHTLESLADAEDEPALARGLSRLGTAIDPIAEPSGVRAIEKATATTAAHHLQTLRRWQQRSSSVLDVFAADQDRRSLRAVMRGAVHGVPTPVRLDGLVPTPLLPVGALAELARQSSPSAVVALLTVWGHPDADRLRPFAQQTQPDMLAIDGALLRGFAARATRISRDDRTLRGFVEETIDIGNAQTAVLIAGGPPDADAASMFVSGGCWLSREAFLGAARGASPVAALTAITASLHDSPLAPTLPIGAGDLAELDRSVLADQLKRLARLARLDPLGTAPILLVLLRIHAQNRDLRTLAWGAALGTPAAVRKAHLVTPT